MQVWAILEYAFALTVVIGVFTLIISQMRLIERAEEQELWREAREKIAQLGQT